MNKDDSKIETPERKLVLRYAVGTLQHLGSQMYSGGLVPTIAELIANAWDADADKVKVTIPFGKPWGPKSSIVVEDDGLGMGFEDCRDKFLVIGRDRRRDGVITSKGRHVMGHKGLGKLACFGVASVVEIRTVKDGWLTHFEIDYSKLIDPSKSPDDQVKYEPPVLADRSAQENNGTKIILRSFNLTRAVDESDFRESMARRFSIFSSQFVVIINDKPLKPFGSVSFDMREPNKGWNQETVENFGDVRWWIGFTEKPVKGKDAQGVAVLAHGRLAQKPFFFDLKGGLTGQFGMQYLVGEVEASGVDEDVDLIATGRESINFYDPRMKPLLDWGQKLVRTQLTEWSEERERRKRESLRRKPAIWGRIERFTSTERNEILKAIDKLAAIDGIDDSRLAELVELFLRAYEDQHFMELIKKLNALEGEKQEELFKLFVEWDVLEAVHTAQIVYGRIGVIEQFEQHLVNRATEKPTMQEFIKDHPWLLNPTWTMLEHERELDNVLIKHFGLDKTREGGSKERLDYFCLAGAGLYVVIDLKRPGDKVGKDELRQVGDYVDYLLEHLGDTPMQGKPSVYGLLVASELKPDAYRLRAEMEPYNKKFVRWEDLLLTAKQLHRDFLNVVRKRAPADHPTIVALESTSVTSGGTVSTAAAKRRKTRTRRPKSNGPPKARTKQRRKRVKK